MKTIATLLTVHNRKDKTIECLSHLFRQEISDGYSLDVYLTDDGCTDGTVEAVKKQFPQVNIITGDGNLYWNRGMYKAWDAASNETDYDFYLWLNDDTNLYEGAVKKLIVCSNKYDDKAIIVGATVNTKSHDIVTYGGRINGNIPVPNGDSVEVGYFNGNIVLVPWYVFSVLGNLDSYFSHSKGDFDYGMRAKAQGVKMYQVGEVLGECDAHERLDKWCDPEVPFSVRWKAMWKPNGMPPHETFHLEHRHKGLVVASFHYMTILIRCFFPKIWSR